MTFGAVVGVKDEVELIGRCLAHLEAIGVQRVVVSDAGSTDGTLEEVCRRMRVQDVLLRAVPAWVQNYRDWSSNCTISASLLRTDYVLFLDADEFPLPTMGHLRDMQLADVVTIPRVNMSDDFTRILSHHHDDPTAKAYAIEHPEEPIAWRQPPPKVCAKVSKVVGVLPGEHDVMTHGEATRRVADDCVIAHLAVTTWPRFRRKVANIRRELVERPAFFEGDYAWHWRKWAEMDDAALYAEWRQSVGVPA